MKSTPLIKRFLPLLAVTLFWYCGFGQRTCGSEFDVKRYQTDSTFRKMVDENERKMATFITAQKMGNTTATVKKIPVVFHVLYNSSYTHETNISVDQILDQINILNRDYRKLNTDAGKTPSVFSGVTADAEIEFCLALVDPNGNPTGGITRTYTDSTVFNNKATMKHNSSGGRDNWNPANYLNIWIVPKIIRDGKNLLGFATFPNTLPANEDGVVIGYKYIGSIGTATAPYAFGRTATHEVGHWLNLKHIWGDEAACTGTDDVADTPNQAGENYDCPTFPKLDACQTMGNGVMFMNYMDYVDDTCMYMFTGDQKSRMRAAMQAFRANYWNESIISCNSCVAAASYSNSITSGDFIYRATAITATQNIVSAQGVVRYQAATSIIWQPGFKATPTSANAGVYALIKSCSTY